MPQHPHACRNPARSCDLAHAARLRLIRKSDVERGTGVDPGEAALVHAFALRSLSSDRRISPRPRQRRTSCALPARRRAMRGAPGREVGGINAHPHHRVAVGLEAFLHFSGDLVPFCPSARQRVAVVKNFQRRRIVGLLDPIGADCGQRFFFGRSMRASLARAVRAGRRSMCGTLNLGAHSFSLHNLGPV